MIAGQTRLDVDAPLPELAGIGGSVILMGIGRDQLTLLHEAGAGSAPAGGAVPHRPGCLTPGPLYDRTAVVKVFR